MHISTTEVLTANLKLGLSEPQTPLRRVSEEHPRCHRSWKAWTRATRGNTGDWVENSLFELA